MASFPKNVEDDSELKDFDDIVIDNSKDDDPIQKDNAEKSVDDLHNAEGPEDPGVLPKDDTLPRP